jgi:hypothetical protein
MSLRSRKTLLVIGLFTMFVAVFCSWTAVHPVFAQDTYGAVSGLKKTAGEAQLSTADTDIYVTIGKIINSVLGLVGILFLVLCIYAGFLWMTSQGNPEQIKKAKTMLVQSIIGMLVIFASYSITQYILEQTMFAAGLGQK